MYGIFFKLQGSLAETEVDDTEWTAANGTVVMVHQASVKTNEIQQIQISGASGGTMTLSWDGETTGNLNPDDDAATIETALELFTGITAGDVIVSDVASGIWDVEFAATYALTDVDLITIDMSAVTGGVITDETTQVAIPGIDEVQRVELYGAPTGGSFSLEMFGESSGLIDYDSDAADFATAIEDWSFMTSSDNTVEKSGEYAWTITYNGSLGWQSLPEVNRDVNTLVSNDGSYIAYDELGTGPLWLSDEDNWSQGRIPNSGDDIVLEKPNTPILFGLKQLGTFTADATTDELTIADHSFVKDQIVRVSTDDTLPSGLAVDTDYYVINPNRHAGTLQLATSAGGSAINIIDTGTGTHYVGVRLNSLEIKNRHNKPIGLSDRNTSSSKPYEEYRQQHLAIGILPAGDKKVTIGSGTGSGSGRMKLDFGVDDVDVKVLNTGGSIEAAVPALLLQINNVGAELDVDNGEVGVAYESDQVYALYAVKQQEGYLEMGEGTISGFVDRTGGDFKSLQMTMLADSYIIMR